MVLSSLPSSMVHLLLDLSWNNLVGWTILAIMVEFEHASILWILGLQHISPISRRRFHNSPDLEGSAYLGYLLVHIEPLVLRSRTRPDRLLHSIILLHRQMALVHASNGDNYQAASRRTIICLAVGLEQSGFVAWS